MDRIQMLAREAFYGCNEALMSAIYERFAAHHNTTIDHITGIGLDQCIYHLSTMDLDVLQVLGIITKEGTES